MSLVLCVLDGWGLGDGSSSDAIACANTPNLSRLMYRYPNSKLEASGSRVGLPKHQFGNSEVGHSTIGSGRKLLQGLPLVNSQIKYLHINNIFTDFIDSINRQNGDFHILGLFSDGGVHSHVDHISKILSHLQPSKTHLHAFIDGRDVVPKSAIQFIQEFSNIATVSGRYYSMDRDNKIERTKLAFEALSFAHGNKFSSAINAIKFYYGQNISDEFIPPCVIGAYEGIEPQDGIIICNFRSDRITQLLHMLDSNLSNKILGMCDYGSRFNHLPSICKKQIPNNTLSEVLASHSFKQLRLAETEKYPHVTFFFNGGLDIKFQHQENILVPSPKVSTYDLCPEMSAVEITNQALKHIPDFDFILMNYANPDMVGHTGSFSATVSAIECVDRCIGRIIESSSFSMEKDHLIITSDHGNADIMYNEKGICTSHTNNPVPFVYVGKNKIRLKQSGDLCDIAPTILDLLKVKKPEEMTGDSLILKDN